MGRPYSDWQIDAKAAHIDRSTELANELANNWKEWRGISGYDSLDACLQGELGITAKMLQERNARHRRKSSATPTVRGSVQAQPSIDEGEQVEDEFDQITAGLSLDIGEDASIEERLGAAVELAEQGLSYRKIGPLVGLDESVVRRDLRVREARDQADPQANGSNTLYESIACRTNTADELISEIEVSLRILFNPEMYELSNRDKRRLRRVLSEAIEKIEETT